MSFNCQKNLSQYLNNAPPFTSNFTKSSPPTILPHHQEQHSKLSPGKFCLSPASSPSLALSASRAASGTKPTSGNLCERDDDDDDNQPLDLSIHTNRDEQSLKRSIVDEHKPVCMVKSCTCCANIPHFQLLLPQSSVTGQLVTRSPNPGVAMSSLSSTDLSFSTQYRTPNSAYSSCSSSASAFLSYNHQPSSWTPSGNSSFQHLTSSGNSSFQHLTSSGNSSFQHLTSSDSVLNGAHNSSNLFHRYGDHIDQDMNIHDHQQLSQQHVEVVDSDDDNGDEPTYMDLDSATTLPFKTNARNEYTGNLNPVYGKTNISQASSTQNRRTEARVEALHSPHQSTLVQALNRGINFTSTGVKSAGCFVGGVISHTSLEKNKKVCSSPPNVSQSSEHVTHQKHHTEQQMYFPHSSPPLSREALPTGHSTYQSMDTSPPQTTLFPPKSTIGQPYNLFVTNGSKYSKVTACEPQSTSAIRHQLNQPASTSILEKSNISGSKSNTFRDSPSSTTNSYQLPVSKKTSVSPNGVTGSQHRRAREADDNASRLQATSQPPESENTKISLLDFWISKILMERSSEAHAPSKPCNVDYICTANGEKKIRLRLVDLMELQVEQSLKA